MPSITELQIAEPGAGPNGIVAGPDGAPWVTLVHRGRIARVGLDGVATMHELDSDRCRPSLIAAAPDGALWFTRPGDGRVGRIGLDGTTLSYRLPTAESGPFGIAAGPDGALWCTEMSTDRLAGVTADGDVEGGRPDHEGRDAILLGRRPRPGLWFTLNRADAIGRYAPVDGETTIVPLPTQGAGPVGLAVGPDEALWFTETNAGQSAG